MPRYIVERTFPDGLHIPVGNGGGGGVLSGDRGQHGCRRDAGPVLRQWRQDEDVLRL